MELRPKGNAKSWSLWALGLLALLLCLAAALTWALDPFFHYHKPLEGVSYTLENQVYQNPGIVSHFDYESLLTGSSMVESLETSWFEAQGAAPMVKAPYAGGYMRDLSTLASIALRKNPALSTLYWGVDTMALFDRAYDETRHSFPTYLYDDNPLNDAGYLLNQDVLFGWVLPSLENSVEGVPSTTFDAYSNSSGLHRFGLHPSLRFYDFKGGAPMPQHGEREGPNPCLINARDNLNHNILPLVEANPQVTFVFFDSPYSVLYWYDIMHEGRLGDTMEAWDYALERLLAYPNVRYYLFDEERLVGNLYNYRDYIHYTANVGEYVVQQLFTDTYQLEKDNYRQRLEGFRALLEGFDYGYLRQETNPFFAAATLADYAALLAEERYTALVAWRVEDPAALAQADLQALEGLGLAPVREAGYVAASRGGQALAQQAGEGALRLEVQVEEQTFFLASGGAEQGVSIAMEDLFPQPVEYTDQEQGLHLVVYDSQLGRVVDNRRF